MTALTAQAPAPGHQPSATGRAILRLHRPALLVWGVLLVLTIGVLLWLHGFKADSERQAIAACLAVPADVCGPGPDTGPFITRVNNLMNLIGEVITYLPCAVAAWAGAALIGRELETGTARLAWTQSLSPTRWLAAKLAVPAAVLAAGTAVLVLVFNWVWTADNDLLVTAWYWDRVFIPRGPVAVSLVLCGLAAGALAGLMLRRTLPALGVAGGFMLAFRLYLYDIWTSIWPANSHTTSAKAHPPADFWPLNLLATGIVLAITALTTAAAFWLLRRRTP
ncbi:hypothetical protein [Streptomyces sp. NPDC051776]|uniref:hypothetical protein n=1 Tax=Streptomyces sp. NPDC051776 TaxID=3155414 RepID=UPI00344378C7